MCTHRRGVERGNVVDGVDNPSLAHDEPERHRFITPQEVATRFGIHVSTVYRWVKRGTLTDFRQGRHIHLDIDEVSGVLNSASLSVRMDAYVNLVVAQAPPLGPDQLMRIGTVFGD
ncbi:helix-turn-helix domain-containing protein [Citricoccus nitrophenolicus]|uniref:helix-turn-helix domain-containing protein n=1 Tax=Citricoccus nitrophenolicus TaxID=863575 RepID=UPI00361F9E1E